MADHYSKLVFLRIDKKYSRVKGYITDLPKDVEVTKLKFRGQSESSYTAEFVPSSYYGGHGPWSPQFDPHNDEILWPNLGTPERNKYDFMNHRGFVGTVNLWRFGQHCQLQALERTSCEGKLGGNPSVVIVNNVISVGAATPERRDGDDFMSVATSQKGFEDKKWKSIPFNTASKSRTGSQSALFTSGEAGFEYVYNVRTSEDFLKKGFVLDMMKGSRFNGLNLDSSLVWQSFDIEADYPVGSMINMTVTRDENTKKWRLYLLYPAEVSTSTGRVICIQALYVPLRPDGSVESYSNSLKGLGQMSIATSGYQELKVFAYDKKVLLAWKEFPKGSTQAVYRGKIGATASDGAFPDASNWKDVELEFEDMPSGHSEAFGMHAVMVPATFEGN